jgi:GT2 family glycosyltransferase
MLSRECWQTIGGLDLRTFARYGWGVDLDLALRARKAGYGLYTTEMAYINHFVGKTANNRFGRRRYEWGAQRAMMRGMRKLYGRNWLKQIPRASLTQPLWRKTVARAIYTTYQLEDRNRPGADAAAGDPVS